MASYPGIYRAKAVSLTGTKLTAFIPQVFGNTSVVIQDYAGAPATGMGWVAFHGGNAEMPVWIGADIPPSPVDARYVNTTGDDMTGTLVINAGTSPAIILNKTGAASFDGAVHIEIRSNGTQIGRITRATSTTAGFLTSSDAELKENFTTIDDALAMQWMTTITPYFFNYKTKPDVRHVGYNAQEVAAEWPNGVANGIIVPGHGNIADRTWDLEGNETTPREVWEAWMMDHSKITPILHACLLTMDRKINARFGVGAARISALEIRVTALETTVATQATQITDLQALVATQGNQITALLQTTAQQTTQITALQQLTATHTTQIAANTAGITKNTTDIATNTTNITKNTQDITANTAAIVKNTTDITTNTVGIAKNTTDIAKNTTDISKNTTDIATNKTAIATLRTDVWYTRRFTAFWSYNVATTAPPATGQIRTNVGNTTVWVHKTDADGYDRGSQFTMLSAGVNLALRDTVGATLNLRSTGAPVDSGTYYTIPVTVVSTVGTVGKSRCEVTMRTGIWATDTAP